jgi:hypothetical protein
VRKQVIVSLLAGALMAAMLPGVAAAKDDGKSACKKGGWQDLVKANGQSFADQAECVAYVSNGGTPRPPETIIAIAYSNLDGTSGFDPGIDVLISKLVDADGGGSPSAGDLIILSRYPTTITPTGSGADFAGFGVTSHVVTGVNYYYPAQNNHCGGPCVNVSVGAYEHQWGFNAYTDDEWWQEISASDWASISDDVGGCQNGCGGIVIKRESQSSPSVAVQNISTVDDGDSDYLEVEVH